METLIEIEEGIKTKDIQRLRDAVTMLAYADLDFSRGLIDEQIKYIESKGINIKDDDINEDIGPIISKTKITFTKDDFAEAVYNLKENFCDERLEDLKKIAKVVYPVEETKSSESKTKTTQTNSKLQEEISNDQNSINAYSSNIKSINKLLSSILTNYSKLLSNCK